MQHNMKWLSVVEVLQEHGFAATRNGARHACLKRGTWGLATLGNCIYLPLCDGDGVKIKSTDIANF